MNRFVSLFALAVLAGFLGILAYEVPRADLIGVIVVTIALAAIDFVRSGGKRR